jgi:hypothetical protein
MKHRQPINAIHFLLVILAFTLYACSPQKEKIEGLQALKISENGRFFVTEDGEPFGWAIPVGYYSTN